MNELGGGNASKHGTLRFGLGKDTELSLSGYDIFTQKTCGSQCAGHLGLSKSVDLRDKRYHLGGSLGVASGGGERCISQISPVTGQPDVFCEPRPSFYSTDLAFSLGYHADESITTYFSLGSQFVQQTQEDGVTNRSAWFRGASGIEIHSGRVRMYVEGGLLGLGLAADLVPQLGSTLLLYYVNTGVQVAFGRGAATQPKDEFSRSVLRWVPPASRPLAKPPSKPEPDPDSLPPLSAQIPSRKPVVPSSAPSSQPQDGDKE